MTDPAYDIVEQARDRAAHWCVRLADGDLSLEEQAEFELWLDENPANRAAFAGVTAIWKGAGKAADAPELIAARADALDAMRAANGQRWSRRLTGRWRAALAIAAGVALVLASSLLLLRDTGQVYRTGIGERRIVQLEDGSRISLDAATAVEVAYTGERRTLRLLSGRAKFDVARDPLRPFSVAAGDKMVVATGTEFSVELLHNQMRVILYEGNVAVLQDGPGEATVRHLRSRSGNAAADQLLRPGGELVAALDQPVGTVIQAETARSLGWERGQLTFVDEPLAHAVERINRYSNLKVQVGDATTANLLISGAFNAGDTEGFVDGVTTLFPLRARREGDVVTLTGGRDTR